ncbi:MAG: eukaryotic-like serine/threonine-protein kinase [Actinomycetota bacterium]|nr:eukaryotic-like serine/threonine-protein kinase [Actinomycetota bacterium]
MSTPQRTFGGRYAVIEPVGSGGMAEVYRARDELLGREVAVKVLHERFARDRAFVERFKREAQSAANINHPNIVSLYDYGSDGDTYYIVMEFIDGRSLAEVIEQEGPLLPERAAEIASEVAQALQRAHATGLVHRDIKPSNVMLTSSGQTKVTDFGIARALGSDAEQTMTQTGMVIGTAAYLSPEQAQGAPVDERSDVYALGVVLYEMLTGRPPFQGDTPLAVAYKHVRETADPPSKLNPDVPASLDAVTMKALAKNRDNRYSSAAEMNEDLQRFLSGGRVQATPLMATQTIAQTPATGTQVLRSTETYETPPRPSRTGLYVLITLLVLGLIAVGVYFLASSLLGGGKAVTVPDVVGKDLSVAQDLLSKKGLHISIDRKNSTKPQDTVLKQDPAGGADAHEGDTVTLTVSGGVAQVDVPTLTGLTLSDAKQQLKDAKLTLGDVTTQPSSSVPKNTVISQFPRAGTQASSGDSVDLVVSGGIEVPSVVGKSQSEALAEIDQAGLNGVVHQAPSDTVPQGDVITQDPAAGTPANEGDTVTIEVSTGPQARSMPSEIGQDADAAQAQLENDFGLQVTQQDYVGSSPCAQPPGRVCAQSPDPGTKVSPGDSATLYVQPGTAFVPGRFLFAIGGAGLQLA